MCLVKMKVEHEDEIPSPPRRIVVRPVSQHSGSDRIVIAHRADLSRPVSRSHSHRSRHSSQRIITLVDPSPRPSRQHLALAPAPAPRPSQYVLSPSRSAPAATSIPRIVHAAPSPPRSPRVGGTGTGGSPRVSYTSVHSSHSRHNSVSGGSPRGSRSRVVSDGEIVYMSTERERGTELRRQSTRGERPRSTGQFLTTAAAAMAAGGAHSRDEVVDSYGCIEPSQRQTLYLEDRDADSIGGIRARSRSITYATTGPRISRERVLVEQDGRRMESYKVMGGR